MMAFLNFLAPLGFFHDPKTSMCSWTDVTSINSFKKDVVSKKHSCRMLMDKIFCIGRKDILI